MFERLRQYFLANPAKDKEISDLVEFTEILDDKRKEHDLEPYIPHQNEVNDQTIEINIDEELSKDASQKENLLDQMRNFFNIKEPSKVSIPHQDIANKVTDSPYHEISRVTTSIQESTQKTKSASQNTTRDTKHILKPKPSAKKPSFFNLQEGSKKASYPTKNKPTNLMKFQGVDNMSPVGYENSGFKDISLDDETKNEMQSLNPKIKAQNIYQKHEINFNNNKMGSFQTSQDMPQNDEPHGQSTLSTPFRRPGFRRSTKDIPKMSSSEKNVPKQTSIEEGNQKQTDSQAYIESDPKTFQDQNHHRLLHKSSRPEVAQKTTTKG